jgi:HD superfamily phosphohydrolase
MAIREKIIRDPVHDVIAFRLDRSGDALLFGLLNCVEFQRLRRIRQLGMASLAYPGADHSRYSHSLGVMQTARRIIEQLCRSFYIAEEDQLLCLAAALVHDLGHGPFSHVFERVSEVKHEALTQQVLLDDESEVHQVLVQRDRSLPQRIVDLLNCKPSRSYFCDILASQLDADRLDYLLRDNLMTGSQYGDYDLNWLLHALTIDEKTNRLAVTWKGISAVEAYLQSRFHMYRNVYFHKVVRSGEGMLKLALQRAKRLAVQGRLEWPPGDNPVYKALLGQQLSIGEFRDLDDISVSHCFKLWTKSSDPILARLCNGLLYRKLYKTIDLTRVPDPLVAQQAVQAAEQAIGAAGGEVAYEMFLDEASDAPYERSDPGDQDVDARESDGEILVLEQDGRLVPFASVSPLAAALDRQLMFRRLHVSGDWRDIADEAVRRALAT